MMISEKNICWIRNAVEIKHLFFFLFYIIVDRHELVENLKRQGNFSKSSYRVYEP